MKLDIVACRFPSQMRRFLNAIFFFLIIFSTLLKRRSCVSCYCVEKVVGDSRALLAIDVMIGVGSLRAKHLSLAAKVKLWGLDSRKEKALETNASNGQVVFPTRYAHLQ